MDYLKHLLVDGWNVIHSEKSLKAALGESQECARKLLAERLAPIHDFLGYRVTIVYDGAGDEISISRLGRHLTFSEVFTPSALSADELIEQMCATSKAPSALIVASRDNMIRLTASGFQVETLTPDDLLSLARCGRGELHAATQRNAAKNSAAWRTALGTANPFEALDILWQELRAIESALALKRKKEREEKKLARKTAKEEEATQAAIKEEAARKKNFADLFEPKAQTKSAADKKPQFKLGLKKLKAPSDAKRKSLKSLSELPKVFKK